ncbi:TonB-dependent receptor plug domain-containing protein [Acinetobacter puyangensis]|uniref:TonB-dependent receptor plug domain-containing protein n=1 Tax=Acinetobacter puyangensis TaxID=1096779 RepID=UPI003A4DA9E5
MLKKFIKKPVLTSSVFVLSALSSAITLANDIQTTLGNDEDTVTLSTVVVTGSRRAVNSHLDSPAPVDVISQEELLQTGAADLARALVSLSASASLPTTPGGGFASATPPSFALRGLAADQTLILVNGKRRHNSAYFTRQGYAGGRGAAVVDISLIPVSAIQRVEILRDGAAAQYGSDAIAGVVNIILKSEDQGGGISYSYGEYRRGDGEQNAINGWKGFALPNDGFLTVAFNAGDRGYADNTNTDNRNFYAGYSNPYATPQYNNDTTPYRDWSFGAPKIKDQYNVSVNAELPVSDTDALYGFATYGHRVTFGRNFYELPNNSALLNRSQYYLERYPDGRIPISEVTVDDFDLTAGYKSGTQKEGKFDVFANFGRNNHSTRNLNGINPSYGSEGPSEYFTGENIFSQYNAGADYSRDFAVGNLASPLTVSAGVAYRWEEYQQIAGDPVAYTRGPYYNPSQVSGVGVPGIYAGITDQDEHSIERNVIGAYLDFEADITEKLNAGLALRAEDYSDFGSTYNGKLSLKYDILPQLTIRSTASTGYRAPSLVQLGYTAFSVQTTTFADGSIGDVQQRTVLPGSEAALLLGGVDLKPEEATNYSLGFVWKPTQNTSATVDIYQIDIDNRVLLSDNLIGDVVTNAFAGTPYSNITNVAFFNNLLDTRTRGIEFTAKHRVDLQDYGQLNLSASYGKNKNEITAARDAVTAAGDIIPSTSIATRSTRGLIEEGSPKDKIILNANWHINDWTLNLAGRRYGEFTTRNATNPAQDQTYGAQWIADIDVGYNAQRLIKGLKFNLGFVNVLDSYPDETLPSTFNGGKTKYSFNSPEGANGSYYYGRISYDF